MNNLFEISKKNSKDGRRKIKMALLEIPQNEADTNKNGLHWKEEYVINNLETLKGMPIAATFLDETKEIPFDHGFTEVSENEPLFENSEGVGCIQEGYIQDLKINGELKRLLIGEGYIFSQRYPLFTKWLEKSVAEGKVRSSIEIMGKQENHNKIIYENNVQAETYRVPQIFSFTGTAILGVEAADDNALILQINQKTKKEDNKMDEKMMSNFIDSIKATIVEVNSQNEEAIEAKKKAEMELSEMKDKCEKAEADIEAKDAEMTKMQETIDEKEAAIKQLEAEVAKIKEQQKLDELEKALADFTDEEKEYAKDEIEAYKQDAINSDVAKIVDKIYAEVGKKAKAVESEAKVSEQNSANKELDIYSDMTSSTEEDYSDIY